MEHTPQKLDKTNLKDIYVIWVPLNRSVHKDEKRVFPFQSQITMNVCLIWLMYLNQYINHTKNLNNYHIKFFINLLNAKSSNSVRGKQIM